MKKLVTTLSVVPVILPALLLSALGFTPLASAAIIGTNPPAPSLTAARVAALPAAQQPAWNSYLSRSDRQLHTDQVFLQNELRKHGLKESTLPPSGRSASSMPLGKPAAWYGETNGQHIADIIVSFQTPAGGWSKNLNMPQHPRAPGEGFAPDNSSRYGSEADFDTPHNVHWNYVGTFDNDATVTELRYLAKVIAAVGTKPGASYRTAFLRGIDYILAAQYPNGGWPQVWPLQGGYHDTITYNDDAVINVLSLLRDVSEATNEFAFVPASTRAHAAASVKRGIECILATQIVADGHRTVWCQQHDPLTLQPASARNYEMPSEVSSESAQIMVFLMQQPNPSPQVITAVRAAAAWFEKTKMSDVAFQRADDGERHLVPSPGDGPLWARYYQIGADRPIFGDRDKTIHDNVDEISRERRFGYAWYRGDPQRALEQYALWAKTHP
jgi:PelA/Pel-15E family pectate lyase